MAKKKIRLDQLIVERKLVASREKAKGLILAGNVFVDKEKVTKAGSQVSSDAKIVIRELKFDYVSRGGIKLKNAIDKLKVEIKDKVCMDIGASTGGFTDCLLKEGAKFVYAVDVGYGLLDYSLQKDERIKVLDRENIRYLEFQKIGKKVDLIVIDVSFISLKLVIPKAIEFLNKGGEILALIKPQFEVGKEDVPRGGVVTDPEKIKNVIEDIKKFTESLGLKVIGTETVPEVVKGKNREEIIYISLIADLIT